MSAKPRRPREVAEVLVRRLPEAVDLPLPKPATAHSSGFDLRARVEGEIEIVPGERRIVPAGIAIALPDSASLKA